MKLNEMKQETEHKAMNAEREQIVARIVHAAGGHLVSRIRMQKVAYLLDQLGEHSGFSYTYHHYGPYSRELDSAIEDAKVLNMIDEVIQHRRSDGASYSVFKNKQEASSNKDEDATAYLSSPVRQALVKRFNDEQIVILELAATAHWLFKYEQIEDWKTEIQRRKGSKTEEGRLEKALELLKDLNLPPAVSQAA